VPYRIKSGHTGTDRAEDRTDNPPVKGERRPLTAGSYGAVGLLVDAGELRDVVLLVVAIAVVTGRMSVAGMIGRLARRAGLRPRAGRGQAGGLLGGRQLAVLAENR
jgi:hypothetical protein